MKEHGSCASVVSCNLMTRGVPAAVGGTDLGHVVAPTLDSSSVKATLASLKSRIEKHESGESHTAVKEK